MPKSLKSKPETLPIKVKDSLNLTPVSKKSISRVSLDVITPQKEIDQDDRVSSMSGKKILEEFVSSPKKGSFGRSGAINLTIPARVSKVYKLINKATGSLGGNGYDGAIYGELTMHSMHKIVNYLVDECNLSTDSRFIDVGSGLGKPNFHVAQYPGVRISIGIELEKIRWELAMNNLSHVLPATGSEWNDLKTTPKIENLKNQQLYGGVNFLVGDVENAASTDPFTHIYMYDLGFPPPLQKAIAEKFNSSKHAEYLISYRGPRRVLSEYGYDVELVHQLPTSMHGSGEIHTCYIYKRLRSGSINKDIQKGCSVIELPPRKGTDDEPLLVHTADLFKDAVINASGDIGSLKAYTSLVLDSFLGSGKPVRTRKPTKVAEAK